MFKLLMALKEDFYFLDYDICKTARCHNAEYHKVNPVAYIRHTLYQPLCTNERIINVLLSTTP